jgi:hypothetical protein
MKLYEIPAQFAALQDSCFDGELTPEALESLAALQAAFTDKVEACCCVIRTLEGQAEVYKNEAMRLASHAGVAERNAERLKKYVLEQMLLLDQSNLQTRLFKVRTQNNPVSVAVDTIADLEKLPAKYRRTKTTVELDKKAVLEDAAAGLPLPEGIRVTRGKHLRIT